MAGIRFELESEVVEWLVSLIKSDSLAAVIEGGDEIFDVTGMNEQENFLPSFGIDYISRRASFEAAAHVLEQLSGLEIISVNKSISLTTGEVLRPDVLCFNPESRSLVVFEVKRSSETERQTVTELAGYEQELRNVAPFLGSIDVCFVVIAADWSTLLAHAVGSMNAWSGKRYLALKVSAVPNGFGLTTLIPEAWHLTGALGLPGEALSSIDIFMHAKGSDDDSYDGEEGPDEEIEEQNEGAAPYPQRIVLTAMEMIAREGDRTGAHGFMMLWRDAGAIGKGGWCLTLVTVDPFAMSAWAANNGLPFRPSDASEYFVSSVEPGEAPRSLYDIASNAMTLLKDEFDPTFGNNALWGAKIHALKNRAVPTRFDFWGSLGRHAREFIANPAARHNYMPFIGANQMDWTDPFVGMTLVSILTEGAPFPGGLIGCEQAFAVGRALGDLVMAADGSDKGDHQAAVLEPMLVWSLLEVVRVGIELRQISINTDDVLSPMPSVSVSPELRLRRAVELSEWVLSDLIGPDHPIHQACFELGFNYASIFNVIEEADLEVFEDEGTAAAAEHVRGLLEAVLSQASRSHGHVLGSTAFLELLSFVGLEATDYERWSQVDGGLTGKLDDRTLLEFFSGLVLPGIDSIIPPVLHKASPPWQARIDWDYLRSGARAMFDSGIKHPAVIFEQDGSIGTGPLPVPFNQGQAVEDPGLEVYVWSRSAVSAFAVKMTWDEVRSFHTRRSTLGSA
ncbi:hypothetical protein MOP98_12565 [Stenotrophomonas maltophilia]|nr:hypothetical protein [Stenotrophomonas maltophilia]